VSAFVFFLIPIGLIATLTALGVGIYSLAKGGSFNKKNGNRLMRLRVEVQAITIGVLMLFTWLIGQGNA